MISFIEFKKEFNMSKSKSTEKRETESGELKEIEELIEFISLMRCFKDISTSFTNYFTQPHQATDKSVKTAGGPILEIQKYCAEKSIINPTAKIVFPHSITYVNDATSYKILASAKVKCNIITENTFVVGVFAPGTHKIALAYGDIVTPISNITEIFKKLCTDNTPAIQQVIIFSQGDGVKSKVHKVLDFIKGRNNIEIKFHHNHLQSETYNLAIDTQGNFSTDSRNIENDLSNEAPYTLIMGEEMVQILDSELGKEFSLFEMDY